MKNILYGRIAISTILFLFALVLRAQDKYIDRNGTLIFEASEKSMEEVKASNGSTTAIFNAETGEIAALALMRGFRFKNSLMEEHFNENYVESDKYPKATFNGVVVGPGPDGFSLQSKEVQVRGTLELHGKTKEIQTPLQMGRIGDTITLAGTFKVVPSDFDIDIPKIVRNKIAREVFVHIDFKLIKK